jgi:hypothetical protein
VAKPTTEHTRVEKLFLVAAQWVRDGHIEVGNQEGFGFVAKKSPPTAPSTRKSPQIPSPHAPFLHTPQQGLLGFQNEPGPHRPGKSPRTGNQVLTGQCPQGSYKARQCIRTRKRHQTHPGCPERDGEPPRTPRAIAQSRILPLARGHTISSLIGAISPVPGW